MSVRFKFKNDLDFSAVMCDGFHISVRDLKRAIVRMKRLGRVTDFDLDVFNDADNEPYDDEDALIPKNSALVIVRRPLGPNQQKVWEEEAKAPSTSSSSASALNLRNTDDLTEDDKISAMMANSTEMYDQKNWQRYRGKALYGGKPPSHYVCMKCHQPGHWVTECPLAKSGINGGEIKKTTGIPRSFLKPTSKDTPGAKINPQGTLKVLFIY